MRLLLAILLIAILLPVHHAFAENGTLKIVFIDVGQGDSTLIVLPNEKTILIDGGERDQNQTVLSTLQDHNITHIDVMVATHPHADHIGGLIGVIENVDVGRVMDSGQLHTTQTFEDLLDAIDAAQIPLSSVHEGDSIDLGPEVKINILNPPVPLSQGIEDELNNNSVVIKLTYGEFTALFTGDMEQYGEQRLLATNREAIDADVLKAGHHGSRYSSTNTFLNAVSPQVVIISTGADNAYGHPHQEALNRMDAAASVQHVFRTDIDGAITLKTNGGSEYTLETAESNKVAVVPEFEMTILIAGISLISLVVLMNSGRPWKSSRPA
jgi:competence protein ComEC